jgi:hypothetical protein
MQRRRTEKQESRRMISFLQQTSAKGKEKAKHGEGNGVERAEKKFRFNI